MEIILAINSDEPPQNLWWAIECLPNNQVFTLDSILPNINPAQYRSMNTLPDTINTANLKHCAASLINADNLHLCITSNPNSTAPYDFLQYIINVPTGAILDKPTHFITVSDKPVYFDLKIEALLDKNYLEIWLIPQKNIGNTIDNTLIKRATAADIVWTIIFIFIGYILLASAIIIAKIIIK